MQALEERNESLESDRNTLRVTQVELHTCYDSLRQMTLLRDDLAHATEALKEKIVAAKQELAEQASSFKIQLREQKEAYEKEIAELQEQYDQLMEQLRVADAQVHALRHEYGLPDGDYSEREMIRELERERKAFDKMFRAHWGVAKKKIRKQAFAANQEDGGKEKENDSADE